MLRQLASLLVLLVPLVESIRTDVCEPNFPEPEEKPFPNVPNVFTAKFQWNMKHVNTSFYVEEYFSQPLNLGVVIVDNMLAPGKRSKLISDPEKQQLIMILDDNGEYGTQCVVTPLSSGSFSFPFKTIKGKELLLSSKSALLLGADSGFMSYVGADVIDEIDVDVWNGCLYIKEQDLTLNATYYFTLNSTDDKTLWKNPSGLKGVIKRAHLVGKTGAGKEVEETYEYAYFKDSIPLDNVHDLQLYQAPLGSYCKDRKTNMKLPNVADFFTFRSEVHDPQQDVLTYTDEWYDFTTNMTRMDHEGLENRDRLARPIKMIHDYQTGLAYIIEKYSGACTIQAIEGVEFDDEIIPGAKTLVRMRSPKEFFNFDDTVDFPWIYEGGFVERGVTTDVWISHRPYPIKNTPTKEMAYWEWYFTSNGWTISNGDVDETLEPFKLVITRPQRGGEQIIYNIYEYNEEPPDERYFSVDECFEQHNESRSYEFVMIADVEKYHLDKNVGTLRYWMAAAIEGATSLRSLRIHGLEFVFAKNRVFVRFTMLGAPNVKGDIANPVSQVPLEEAERRLLNSIQTQEFLVFYLMPGGKTATFSVDKDSLAKVEYHRNGTQSVYYVISDDGKDGATAKPVVVAAAVSSGSAAALAIVLLIVGVGIVGGSYYFLCYRKERKLESHRTGQLTMNDM